MDKAYLRHLHQQARPKNFRPRASTWYEIKNTAADSAEINLYDEIGMWGVSASSFAEDLRSITASSITLRISSPGGDVHDGLTILNALRQHPAMVNVVIEGLAASAASFIAMAGDTVQMAPQAMMMIHDASGMCWGNAEDMFEMAAVLDKHSDNIAAIYAQRAGGTAEDWRAVMKAETWYTDQEAVDAGLADAILGKATSQPPEGDPEEAAGAEAGEASGPPRQPGASLETTVTNTSEDGGTSPQIDMPTTEKPAAWDLSVIRAAITAAKEATTHG